MRAFDVGATPRPGTHPPLIVSLFVVLICYAPPPAAAQYIKQVDEHGNVSYSDDPNYDYSVDEPTLEQQHRHAERIEELRNSLQSRDASPAVRPRAPHTTVRTGRAVCRSRPSISRLRLGCR